MLLTDYLDRKIEIPERRVCENTLYAAVRAKEMPKESIPPTRVKIEDRPYRLL